MSADLHPRLFHTGGLHGVKKKEREPCLIGASLASLASFNICARRIDQQLDGDWPDSSYGGYSSSRCKFNDRATSAGSTKSGTAVARRTSKTRCRRCDEHVGKLL